jgi:hypothetical protein
MHPSFFNDVVLRLIWGKTFIKEQFNTTWELRYQNAYWAKCIRECTLSVFLFVPGATVLSGPEPPHSRGFYITYNYAPHSVGLLWTSDQLFADTST